MKQALFGFNATMQTESGAFRKCIQWCEFVCWQPCDSAEEGIHGALDQPASQPQPSAGCNLKISPQPAGMRSCNGGNLWRPILVPLAETVMQPKNRRQSTGNQPEVVEVGMEKAMVRVRLDRPAVEDVNGAAQKK